MNQEEFTDYLFEKGYSTRSIYSFIMSVKRFRVWIINNNSQLETTTQGDILLYVKTRQKQVLQRTIQLEINSIKHYFNYLMNSGVIQRNPTVNLVIKGVQKNKLYSILDFQSLEGIYASYCSDERLEIKKKMKKTLSESIHFRNRVIIGMMIYQGLGKGELERLKIEDVRLHQGKLFVRGARRSNERELSLQACQMMDLMQFLLTHRNLLVNHVSYTGDCFFFSMGGFPSLQNPLHELMKEIKLISNSLDSFKHLRTSVIVHWLSKYDLRKVQYMAGHRYISSTERYLQNTIDDLKEDIADFHPLG